MLLIWPALLGCDLKSQDTATPDTEDSGVPDSGEPGETGEDPDAEIRAIQPSTLPMGPEPCREPILMRVDYVYDGDTAFVTPDGGGTEEKIRLISLDTPEISYEDDPGECYGDESRDYMAGLIEGELVWLTFDYKCLDDYDRTLVYVHRGLAADEFINRNLLRYGYAETYFWDDGLTETFDPLFAEDEAAAREEGLGLWGECY